MLHNTNTAPKGHPMFQVFDSGQPGMPEIMESSLQARLGAGSPLQSPNNPSFSIVHRFRTHGSTCLSNPSVHSTAADCGSLSDHHLTYHGLESVQPNSPHGSSDSSLLSEIKTPAWIYHSFIDNEIDQDEQNHEGIDYPSDPDNREETIDQSSDQSGYEAQPDSPYDEEFQADLDAVVKQARAVMCTEQIAVRNALRAAAGPSPQGRMGTGHLHSGSAPNKPIAINSPVPDAYLVLPRAQPSSIASSRTRRPTTNTSYNLASQGSATESHRENTDEADLCDSSPAVPTMVLDSHERHDTVLGRSSKHPPKNDTPPLRYRSESDSEVSEYVNDEMLGRTEQNPRKRKATSNDTAPAKRQKRPVTRQNRIRMMEHFSDAMDWEKLTSLMQAETKSNGTTAQQCRKRVKREAQKLKRSWDGWVVEKVAERNRKRSGKTH